ncbi:hypothetical protein MLD38_008118 [Melastoma candidum]|uniref:Uncharacterized protein n=1 Tax=Melastoma candidum TaxID=119954 RepID=A0ACB9RWC8_9MYRT|nr:hypothetical protein MLD38_008118 [Melastoma candidum]
MGGGGGSSSGEEDEDEELKAAIDSISSDPFVANCFAPGISTSASRASPAVDRPRTPLAEDEAGCKIQTQLPKHYQIKAQKLLDDILEKNLVMIKDPIEFPDIGKEGDRGGIRLFKKAPPGILFDHSCEPEGPKKKPRILPGDEVDEKSKEFRRKIRCCVVNGSDVVTAAVDACKKSIARLEAKDAAAKTAVKREEERVAKLRNLRGERWLPSIARETQRSSGKN